MTTAAIGLQGIGSAATYIGILLYMTKSVIESGLPQTQANAMVSRCGWLRSAWATLLGPLWGVLHLTW